MIIAVFAATVAWASYPAGIIAFVPVMKINGQQNKEVMTATGVRFLPYLRI